MKRSNRLVWLGAIALAVIILLSLIAAPSSKNLSGSTYNRAPDGYSAWYAFMQQQGTSIQRWQKPLSELHHQKGPATLLRVNGNLNPPVLDGEEQEWVEKGNTLVILGVSQPVTAAEFSTKQQSPFGDIQIDTSRRRQNTKQSQFNLGDGLRPTIGDRFGAVVWEEKYKQGRVIFATTPYLAANAYQDYLSNFRYLADLVTKKSNTVLIDEYIHGYKDADVREKEGQGNLFSYLAKTPLFPALVQVSILLLVLIWAQNRRFGKPVTLNTAVVDNSKAYIQALAGVLQKAESSDFVVEMLGKEEQQQLQKALGLGLVLLEHQTLINLWVEKTGASATELDAVLKLRSPPALRSAQSPTLHPSPSPKQPMSQPDLLSWLGKWQTLREIQNMPTTPVKDTKFKNFK
ncbi:DUF4350 domain-containing protein [Cylindrospermum sp. FACHB-282]|uniref:DUF4350 domain-containing protein n=1 Tax=Cylindrospermum sp. FACHB-282 TaxID=2692794 RepID=UPI00168553C9|nr:DUF4350 domain-containing protein [Cylindrospermum sp. FACHB-282]MBD2387720.1 DUF4350 domain-containing protein [Cylindrospermum sp. FACHB-282]